ncbi:MAG TPA: DEAD/DEAH box helicase, partial [Tetragenococcus sp.]|nr:DEAD/DEAH box helicase [Tetragenococcus sp.]
MSFAAFGFQSFINQALAESKFDQPTEVQEKLIPIIQDGRNIIGQSQTGSGKTHTFLLPLIDQIDPQLQKVQIVITTPSR